MKISICLSWALACFLCSLFPVNLFIGIVSSELCNSGVCYDVAVNVHLSMDFVWFQESWSDVDGCECAFEVGHAFGSAFNELWWDDFNFEVNQNTIDAGLRMWRVELLIPADEIPFVHVTTRLLTRASCLFAESSESHHKDSSLSQLSHKSMWNGLRRY